MNAVDGKPQFTYGEIEGTLRTQLALVEGAEAASARRKASRGLLYFTLDLVKRMPDKRELDHLVGKLRQGEYPG